MIELSPDNRERLENREVFTTISAEELCDAFGSMGDELIELGRAQYLGNHISPYNGLLDITNRREKHGRVTHVGLYAPPVGNKPFQYTHEIHFPSVDSEGKDYSVAKAVLIKHEYNDDGELKNSHALSLETVDLEDPETEAFMADLEASFEQAKVKAY